MTDVPPRKPSDPTVIDRPLPLPASERTLVDPPAMANLVDARTRTIADRGTSDRIVPEPSAVPVIPDVGIEKRLNPNMPSQSRYAIGSLLGTGSTSHVYAGHDRTFDREVAIKFLETGLAQDGRRLSRFIREARMTARLDHPNIVPVYNLNATPSGDLYLTMRRVNGLSLGDALRQAAEGNLPVELGDMNRRVNTMLKVCDALACAHDRGVAHLDVKPDNIMLGPFGEVVLVDWGLARRFEEEPRARQHISGTPAYMSPEQSAGHPGDALADIYCLGATLFHVLTLRHPTWATDEAEFWEKKRAGTIDLPTADERASIPKQLLAIALKALAADREERYPSVKAMSEDLQHYQAGLAVSAYRESMLERAMRWHRRHAMPLWTGIAAVAAVLLSALFVYGERLKEIVAWGAPIYQQSFSDDSWRADFNDVNDIQCDAGARWEREDGRVVSKGLESNFLFLNRRLFGPVAVEVEGEMTPGNPACDLSLAWSLNDPSTERTWLNDAYLLQVGANDNAYAIISNGFGDETYVRDVMHVDSGKRYRLRFEIDDDRLSIDMDGRRICEYRVPFPCTSGFIGLYAYYPGKAFDDFTVYSKGVPQRLSPIATGDAFYQRDLPLEAAEEYRLVVDSLAGTEWADQARYKQGLCFAKLGKRKEALELWEPLRDHALRNKAECTRIEWMNSAGDITGAIDRFTKLYKAEPALRSRLHLLYSVVLSATVRNMRDSADGWLALASNGLLPQEPIIDGAVAKALFNLGLFEDVVKRYPNVERQAALALFKLGRSAEILKRYPDLPVSMRKAAMIEVGMLDECLKNLPLTSSNHDILHIQGQHQEALNTPGSPEQHNQNRIWLGMAKDVLEETKPGKSLWYIAMMHLGRIEEALGQKPVDSKPPVSIRLRGHRYDELLAETGIHDPDSRMQPLLGKWLAALQRHDPVAADIALADAHLPEVSIRFPYPWFVRFIGVEFVRVHGDAEAFGAAMRVLEKRGSEWLIQRPWYAARFLLDEIDETAFLNQPACGQAPAALLVLRALRAELAGNRAAACTDYRTYLALPLHMRAWDVLEGDPITDDFVAWRLAELGR